MLKITIQPAPNHILLQLEGALTGPWTDELRHHLQSAPTSIHLDLSGITYMDAAAAHLIREHLAKGVTITSVSHFASLMLQLNEARP